MITRPIPNSSMTYLVGPGSEEWGEDGLDKEIVAAVEDGGRPEALRAQSQPRQDEAVGNDHESEAGKAIPGGRAFVVVAEKQDGKMIGGPHQAADQAHAGEPDDLRQFRHKKSAPADLFPKRARGFADET